MAADKTIDRRLEDVVASLHGVRSYLNGVSAGQLAAAIVERSITELDAIRTALTGEQHHG